MYVTVRCQNKAGLVTEKSSNGVVVLISGPSNLSAVLRVLPLNVSHYATRDTTQFMTNTSLVAIEGFYDPVGVTSYQVCAFYLLSIVFREKSLLYVCMLKIRSVSHF